MSTWDEHGNPITPAKQSWDEHGNPIAAAGGTGMTPGAALGAMGAIGRGAQAPAESEEGGFLSGLAGSATKVHPIEAVKNLWAAGEKEYQELKEHPLKTMLTLYGKSVIAQEELVMGVNLNILKDLSAVRQQQQQHPNVGAEPFQVGQALAPQLKTTLPLGNIASAPNLPNAIGQGANAALGLIALLPAGEVTKVPAITRGVAPDASRLSEWLENKLSKFPTSGALDKAYAKNQTILRATMSEAVADATNQVVPEALQQDVLKAGVKLDAGGRPILNLNPDEIVENFNKGAKTLESTAKANYKVADKYMDENTKTVVQNFMKDLQKANPMEAGNFATSEILDNPVMGMKTVIGKLNQQGQRLVNAGRGIEAHGLFQQADRLSEILEGVKAKMPPEVQKAWAEGDRIWSNKSALEDIADVLKDPSMVHGAAPSAQNALTKVQQQTVAGEKLLREATMGDKAYRFQQVFGPTTTKEITDLADLIGKQQALKGQGSKGIGGMMMGAGMLLGALRGGPVGALSPLVGLDLLTRAMATPSNWGLVKSLLTANPAIATSMIAPRIIQNLQQSGQMPGYLRQVQPAPAPQPQASVPTGATIGEQLKAKGVLPNPLDQSNFIQAGLPFHPNQRINP